MTPEEAKQIIRAASYWHYPFALPWGERIMPTRAAPSRHPHRVTHLFAPLIEHYAGTLAGKRALDLACCQGFWSFEAARRGAQSCLGIDSSPNFIREAEALGTVFELSNCEFRCAHLEEDLWWMNLSGFDVTFFFGLFYHLADPVFVLRRAMELTKETLIIDTNVTSDRKATLTIVARDPAEPTTARSRLSTSIRVVPSQAALRELLSDGGFTRVEYIKPHRQMPREYHQGACELYRLPLE